jgi:hypothetical protein
MAVHQLALGIPPTTLTEHLIPAQEILLMALMEQHALVLAIQLTVIKIEKIIA